MSYMGQRRAGLRPIAGLGGVTVTYLSGVGADEAGGDAGDPEGGESAPPTIQDVHGAITRMQKTQADLLESQKRTETLRMIGTGAAVFGVIVGLVRLGDMVRQMRQRKAA